MARSPSEATRFTATGPYIPSASSSPGFNSNPTPFASSAPPTGGSRINVGGPAPHGETPQQKIARLRAAAAATKRGKESGMDSAVRIGRAFADRAHRFTAIGLIGLTVVSGVVATAGITDMLLHNRRRRNEWLAEQQVKTAVETAEAKRAAQRGEATEDQMLLINRERVAKLAAEEKANRPGLFKRTTGWLFSGLSTEEQKGGRLGAAVRQEASAVADAATAAIGGEEANAGVLHAVQEKVASSRIAVQSGGGPLDRQAQAAVDDLASKGRGWTSWMTNR